MKRRRKKNEPGPHDPLTTAERRLVEKHVGLVYSIANQRRLKHGLSRCLVDDITQAGFLGLMRAAQKFDPSRGYKFSTCAIMWIKSKMGHELKARTVGKPRDAKPVSMISIDTNPVVIDHCGTNPGEQVHVENEMVATEFLECLNPRELVCVRGFMDGRTLASIGDELGVHKERARQIREASLEKLRFVLMQKEVEASVKSSDLDVPAA